MPNAGLGGLDLEWQDSRLTPASLRSDKNGDYEIANRDHAMKLRFRANETAHVVLRGGRLVRA